MIDCNVEKHVNIFIMSYEQFNGLSADDIDDNDIFNIVDQMESIFEQLDNFNGSSRFQADNIVDNVRLFTKTGFRPIKVFVQK